MNLPTLLPTLDRIHERAAMTPARRWLANASAVLKARPELRADADRRGK